MKHNYCVGTYVTTRLEQLGVTHVFSVPGDYTSDFLEIIDEKSNLTRIGNCNELNAGYAADGYARIKGIGVVCVTSGVGAFSLLNAIAGAYAEATPVVILVGTLSNSNRLKEINSAERYHHQVSVTDMNQVVFRNVTVAHELISNPEMAPWQIDNALRNCITYRKPVIIEMTQDVYYLPCTAPQNEIIRQKLYTPYSQMLELASSNKIIAEIVKSVKSAVAETMLKLRTAKYPILWIGNEIAIFNLQEKILKILQMTNLPFVVSFLGKSVLSENTPNFLGIYEGVFTNPQASEYIKQSDLMISLGVWNTDINNLGIQTYASGNPSDVFASRGVVRIGVNLYPQVLLENFIEELIIAIESEKLNFNKNILLTTPLLHSEQKDGIITFDSFFAGLNNFINEDNIVIADIGISANGASSFLTINRQNGYHIQALWASIGWSVPAGTGAAFATNARVVIITGDGAFKLTCQEISTMIHNGCNPIFFVLNNGVYAVEQMFLDAKTFRSDEIPFEEANVLQRWNYDGLMMAFSNGDTSKGRSAQVKSIADLNEILKKIDESPECCWLIDIHLNERDYPSAWNAIVNPKK